MNLNKQFPSNQPSLPSHSIGTQLVVIRDCHDLRSNQLIDRGTIGRVISVLPDKSVAIGGQALAEKAYELEVLSGERCYVPSTVVTTLVKFTTNHELETNDAAQYLDRVILQVIVGSQAYGLSDDNSDIDRRGAFLPRAKDHWSLYGVPEQFECFETQESYFELQKLIQLALKANPMALEILYSPLVERMTPLAEELLSIRKIFLSKLVYQTHNGYILSQFRLIQNCIERGKPIKWKHAMHLIRLLLVGINTVRTSDIHLIVRDNERSALLEIKNGEWTWEEVDRWRRELHDTLDDAYRSTELPERPDVEKANQFLIYARNLAVKDELP